MTLNLAQFYMCSNCGMVVLKSKHIAAVVCQDQDNLAILKDAKLK